MAKLELSPGPCPDWKVPEVGDLTPEALAKRAAEQLQVLRRDWPQQAFPELLPNGPVLWHQLAGCPVGSTEVSSADPESKQPK